MENRKLKMGELLSYHAELADTMILCEAGVVWLTEEGYKQDIILEAGEAYSTRGTGLVIVQALVDSNIIVPGLLALAA